METKTENHGSTQDYITSPVSLNVYLRVFRFVGKRIFENRNSLITAGVRKDIIIT